MSKIWLEQDTFGPNWPWKVPSGTLETLPGSGDIAPIVFHADGKTYWLNGTAKMLKRFEDPESIWAPAHPGAGKDISWFIRSAHALAKRED